MNRPDPSADSPSSSSPERTRAKAPYYAVIFTSEQTADTDGYEAMAARMVELAAAQPGFLGIESARSGLGITVSYWKDLASIAAWRAHAEHLVAQRLGRERWYSRFTLRVARVEQEWTFQRPEDGTASSL